MQGNALMTSQMLQKEITRGIIFHELSFKSDELYLQLNINLTLIIGVNTVIALQVPTIDKDKD
jgi:hypothetical protein